LARSHVHKEGKAFLPFPCYPYNRIDTPLQLMPWSETMSERTGTEIYSEVLSKILIDDTNYDKTQSTSPRNGM
jgi:hypothetical protein